MKGGVGPECIVGLSSSWAPGKRNTDLSLSPPPQRQVQAVR